MNVRNTAAWKESKVSTGLSSCPVHPCIVPPTGHPALSPHHRKPSSPYVLENNLFQQIHRAGGFGGQIQQRLALTGQLTEPSDGKCSPKGCSTPPKVKVSPVALKQALMQAGARQPPQKPKNFHNPWSSSACAQVPVLQAGSLVLQQLPQTRSHSHVGQPCTLRGGARISLGGAEDTPI